MAKKDLLDKQLQAEVKEIKAELKTLLLDDTVINDVLDTLYYGYTDLQDVAIKESVRNNVEALLCIQRGNYDVDAETQEEIEKRTHKEYWKEETERRAEFYKTLLDSTDASPIAERPNYIKLVNYITGSTKAKGRGQTAEELIEAYGDTLLKIDDTIPTFINYYLQDEIGIDGNQAFRMSVLTFLTGNSLIEEYDKLRRDYLTDVEESNLKYVVALADVRANLTELKEKAGHKEKGGKLVVLYDPKEKESTKKIVPFKLPYTEYLTVAETEMLSVITSKRFTLDHNAMKYSEETINSLEEIDQEILDYITLVLYHHGYYYFTDRHIAVALYKKTPTATVSDAMLEEVNASLTRIQNVNLPVGYISEEINKKGKRAKIKRDSKLIWLDVINYDYETKSTVYRIVDRPPYYDYAIQTGRLSEYRREIITRDIKGIQQNTKNTTLKQRLIRNIQALKQFNSVTMPIQEVYNILAITDNRKYTEARKKAKEMLNDLQANDFNFSYEIMKRNGVISGIKFTRYTDRPLEK